MAALRILACGNLVAVPKSVQLLNRVTTTRVSQIQQRWSSYQSSSKYKTPEDYTDYEISKNENEWKYVERLLPYKIIPKPSTTENKFPSGYKPASASPKDNPYFIERTKNYMQPVYLYRNPRGCKRVTEITKIQGNIWALEQDIQQYVQQNMGHRLASQINEFAGLLKFKGDYVNCIKKWMDTKGF
ncbi:PREDICTED: probable 39S ribosomal protein L49, mitochondrial [Trachymyrmex cornetzi]|uniref:Large ribosomal subunit protein mL49 n=1 Tax=Trachymyrmex cornetzi TaxID=471704 RepID=A0A195D7P2_9HYME|nr:PREDICTED: probable 39S ribosomal protein L49, mitochondrial [Trachymyrmex cornetzi]KYN08905.1 putative 39S ribosomal protein L49, mitochondrial [Trachymyrmex cornetzi]